MNGLHWVEPLGLSQDLCPGRECSFRTKSYFVDLMSMYGIVQS